MPCRIQRGGEAAAARVGGRGGRRPRRRTGALRLPPRRPQAARDRHVAQQDAHPAAGGVVPSHPSNTFSVTALVHQMSRV